MRLLLDTHILLWWFSDPSRLTADVRQRISNPEHTVLVSVATLWEIRIKQKLGKLDLPSEFDQALDTAEFVWLPVSRAHVNATAELALHHRDPFDRMLVAQAQCEDLTLITADERLVSYGKNVLWMR